MNILMLTPIFAPEPSHLRGMGFAQEVQRRGHHLQILTGFPSYPQGRVYPGYRTRWHSDETRDGVSIHRVAAYPSHDRSAGRRALSYLSLSLSACAHIRHVKPRPDVVYVDTGPITLAWAAMWNRRCHRVPWVLDVSDLWPDSVSASGMLRSRAAMRLLHGVCGRAYRDAAHIVVLSDGYRQVLAERGVPADKMSVVLNWCDEDALLAGGDERALPELLSGRSGRFTVVYAGTMGPVQALGTVLDAAAKLHQTDPNVLFVLVGSGIEADALKARAASERLTNVLCVPPVGPGEIGQVLRSAGALLLHLRDDPLCRVGIPQKTQAYLAAGRPVIAATCGEAARLVERAGAGVTCAPEDPAALASAVAGLARMPATEREALGRSGNAFYKRELSFQVGISQLLGVLEQATSGGCA